jgi:hypothetical protein
MKSYSFKLTTFALGVVAGVLLKDTLKRTWEQWSRATLGSERTVVYDANLPDSLERREPAPVQNQPRYGGTGAIGVSPALVTNASRESGRE